MNVELVAFQLRDDTPTEYKPDVNAPATVLRPCNTKVTGISTEFPSDKVQLLVNEPAVHVEGIVNEVEVAADDNVASSTPFL